MKRRRRAWGCWAAAGALAVAATAAAQQVTRTELGRQPVSGDDSREVVTQLVEIPPGATSRRTSTTAKRPST